ncbi:SpoIVB peptidase S55 domain-containing protein [Agathobacter rectalis]|jgi:stage IV sporulation protein B|uniref:Stage IV sporulation protein B n=1 Tax=Agathobacter rectalis TaxID=39491 RepID=A0A3E4YFG4_9FIRM|nr:SpoIVB peptidase S55 domain-containing protein [Agathobacter rectalis]RGM73261.1 stage IV sporulation protein B [Agathobacter rectalis]RGU26051.1 stage IV sporulation protein B [Agathobacter rectalis]
MRKFFGKFVSVTLAAVVIAMFALSSDDKWCSRVDKAFDESALGSFLNESKAGYGRYATGLPGQAASVLADSGENGENGENGGNGGNGENSGNEQDIGQTADTASTHRATDRDYEETDKISDGIRVEGVYACGRLTGIYEQTEGVLVVNTTEVTDEDGKKVNPADKRVQCGDYILSVNGRTVADKEELSEAVNDIMKEYDESGTVESQKEIINENKSDSDEIKSEINKRMVKIKFLRGGKEMSADITPVRMDDGRYYMGIWVKDDLAGIGTITYYTKDGRFGALGHGIGDGTQSGNLLYANSGDLYSMKLTKIKKGKSGAPGEIGGVVYFGKKSHIGTLDCNSNLGIYGQLDSDELSEYAAEDTYYPVAGKDEIHTGSAQMISEISGKLEKYNLEITNIDKKATDTNKGMELKVTDDRLIELSGGIVQGTSGSPIIQDGKIIGAVTHVFVDDPTGGYGICIDEML